MTQKLSSCYVLSALTSSSYGKWSSLMCTSVLSHYTAMLQRPKQFIKAVTILLLAVQSFVSPVSSNNIGYFWHVTDFHLDFTYETFQYSCQIKVRSPGVYGDYDCDSPWRLIKDTIRAMYAIEKNFEFILWTGDTVGHLPREILSEKVTLEVLKNVTAAFNDSNGFVVTKKFIVTAGNLDYYPVNQSPQDESEYANKIASVWREWLDDLMPMHKEKFLKGGYYTRTIGKLRIVCVNTNLYYIKNNMTGLWIDPSSQFGWLNEVLQEAKALNEKVIMVGHMPPGVHTPARVIWFRDNFHNSFLNIISKFADVIVAMHFGHDHYDGFKVFQDIDGVPTVPMFVAPSVAPSRRKMENGQFSPVHNPAIRLVSYDLETGRHLDIQQYYLDLHSNNLQAEPGHRATYSLLYSFTTQYKVADLTAGSLMTLIKRIRWSNEDHILQDYYRFSTSAAKQWGNSTRCDSQCQIHIECGFTYHYMNEFDLCVREAQNRRSAEKTAATSPSLYISTVDVALASFLSVLAFI